MTSLSDTQSCTLGLVIEPSLWPCSILFAAAILQASQLGGKRLALSLIYARSENYCIGRAGELPWSLPDELAHFLRTVAGKALIMGRKTYQDPHAYHSSHLNVVISRHPQFAVREGFMLASSLPEAIEHAGGSEEDVFLIGGSSLFVEAIPLANQVYETVVHAEVEGDTYIEPLDFSGWDSAVMEQHPVDENHAYPYTVFRHRRRL